MQQAFYFDQTRCTGCHACVVACKDWNDLPAELVFWRRVETYEEGKFPDVRVYHVTVSCNHCEQPACAAACPDEAIVKRDNGVVLIEYDKCTGCQVCGDACPYGAIQFRPGDDARAEKCTFCSDRLADGEIPVCVGACPMRALDYGDLTELASRPEVARVAKHLPDGTQTTGSLVIKPKL